MPSFEYQTIDSSEGSSSDSVAQQCTKTICSRRGAIATISIFVIVWLLGSASSNSNFIRSSRDEDLHVIMHISDTHVDPFFDPTESMMKGVCHSCDFSSKVWGDKTFCPGESGIKGDHDIDTIDRQLGYAFGR